MINAGLLVLRIVLGLVVAAHGAQKLLGWFDGPGLEGFAASLDRLGVRPGKAWALVSAVVEVGGGFLLVIGLFTPLAALLIAGNLLVAILTIHISRGFWNEAGGFEYPLSLAGTLVALSLIGPGRISLDALIGSRLSLSQPPVWLVIVIVVLLGVLAAVSAPRFQPGLGRGGAAAERK